MINYFTKIIALVSYFLLASLMTPPMLFAQQELVIPSQSAMSPASKLTLAERLGFKPTDKVVIINGDDMGLSQATNAATIDAMGNGLLTSATVMVPCSWFPEVAEYARENIRADLGVHLTLTSEWENYRWVPVASDGDVLSLKDPQGYFWSSREALYANANLKHVEMEAREQIKKALASGIDVTHLDSHMLTLQVNEPYFQIYRKLAREFDLPVRMIMPHWLPDGVGAKQRRQLDEDGIIYPDYLILGVPDKGESERNFWKRMINSIKSGVTELSVHVSLNTIEMKMITEDSQYNSYEDRAAEYELFAKDPEIRKFIRAKGIKLIGYRALRDLQRQARKIAKLQ